MVGLAKPITYNGQYLLALADVEFRVSDLVLDAHIDIVAPVLVHIVMGGVGDVAVDRDQWWLCSLSFLNLRPNFHWW